MSTRSGAASSLSSTNNNSSGLVEVKSKFDAEFRRFSITKSSTADVEEFRAMVQDLHRLKDIPFTLCYTDAQGDLLPINNDDNFRKALDSCGTLLRLLLQRKGESLEEKYGYGTPLDSLRRRNRISRFLGAGMMLNGGGATGGGGLGVGGGVGGAASSIPSPTRSYDISMPLQDFRQLSAIIDVDVVPETHRRVKLCKHGSDKPLGFYIRDGTSVRITPQGLLKVPGIFISRLVPGGLAESTGLLAVNDEVLEVNGIEVAGKTLDQVTDMMVANASNLIVTIRPADQRMTLARGDDSRGSRTSHGSEARSSVYASNDSDDEQDEVRDMMHQRT